jgi:hypothetical protein
MNVFTSFPQKDDFFQLVFVNDTVLTAEKGKKFVFSVSPAPDLHIIPLASGRFFEAN